MGVLFDGGACVERLAVWADYKANRPAMPEALRAQLDFVREYLDLAEIPWRREEGHEADDIIASCAVNAAAGVGDVLVATSDKDMFQLVNEHVYVVPVSGVQERMDAAAVREKTGVAPEQIVAWLALVGDAADNIPGVPGIGPKTAARLLQEFGTLADLRDGLNSMPVSRTRDALRENWARVERNVGLVKLRSDLSCPADWNAWRVKTPTPARLVPFFRRMEFRGLAEECEQRELF